MESQKTSQNINNTSNLTNPNRKPTKLPQKPVTHVNKFEKVGYKVANKVHKYAVLSLVFFILGNLVYFAKEYNNYWRARRVINIYLNIYIFLFLESKFNF